MQRFKNLIVSLSLKDEEAAVIRWTSTVACMAGSDEIVAIHAWDPVELPEALKSRYPWLSEPGADALRKRMDAKIDEHLKAKESVKIERIVKQGSSLGEVLSLAERNQSDLAICGRSTEEFYLSEKLARKAPCSVLSVPADASTDVKHVLVATDFSTHSDQALEIGLAFAHEAGASLTLLHAFTIPWGEAKATTARPEILSEFEQLHTARLRQMAARMDSRGVETNYRVVESSSPPAAVNAAVESGGYGLVVIGCRGRHAIYATLLGSTAEAILQSCLVPVIAVKSKGASRQLLAALRDN